MPDRMIQRFDEQQKVLEGGMKALQRDQTDRKRTRRVVIAAVSLVALALVVACLLAWVPYRNSIRTDCRARISGEQNAVKDAAAIESRRLQIAVGEYALNEAPASEIQAPIDNMRDLNRKIKTFAEEGETLQDRTQAECPGIIPSLP